MDQIALTVFYHRVRSLCEEMAAALRMSAISPNIRDRLDYSTAIFDHDGHLVAQSAAIPVHLGSMAYALPELAASNDWQPEHQLVLNDPYRGGTHLPDVTVIAPVFVAGELVALVANRVHHARIGCEVPGSMPLATTIEEEGLIISPTMVANNQVEALLENLKPDYDWGHTAADMNAQFAANALGIRRLMRSVDDWSLVGWHDRVDELNKYADTIAANAIKTLPLGNWEFRRSMEDDGNGTTDISIAGRIVVEEDRILVDFGETVPQVKGNINAPVSVAVAAVHFFFKSVFAVELPNCHGATSRIQVTAPEGSLVNARYPAAVAAGNVETSMQIVEALRSAMADALPDVMPAASQATMNNVAMGGRFSGAVWDYYETIGGGAGASLDADGAHGVHVHMTNTLNSSAEVLELSYPMRLRRYALADGSFGNGSTQGGSGVTREFEFLAPTVVTLITDQRQRGPAGLAGGSDGAPGRNMANGSVLPGKSSVSFEPGERLCITTPGGGGYGAP